MTTSEEPAADADLEQLLAAAIGCLEDGGQAALTEFLTEHAAVAPRVREALADLELVDRYSTVDQTTPQRFGEFVVRSQLGAGGMGVVYLAEQTSLGREVALKVVRPELLLFDGSKERFLREVDAVARIQHSAIVPILATGSEDGVPWYAMPKLPGKSGEEIVRHFAEAEPVALTGTDLRRFLVGMHEGAIESASGAADSNRGSQVFAGPWWRAITAALVSAVDGIHHAHLSGIVHRDLKPSNVMLDADGSAVVLDFGLAQVQGSARLTRTGGAAGSPAYMAPEQVRGEPADERTDVYGLGATLACLLGLRLPVAGRDEGELREQILTGQRRELRRRAGLPVELSIVIACAMDVDRTRRYENAAAFAADLRSVLDGRPIAARRLPAFVRVRRFAQRHRSVSIAIGMIVLFAVLVPMLLLLQAEAANTRLQGQVARSDASVALTIDAVDGLLLELSVKELRNHPATQQVALRLLRRAESLFDEIREDERYHDRVEGLQTRALAQIVVFESLLGNAAAATAAAERFIELATARLEVAEDPGMRTKLGSARAELAEQWFRAGLEDDARAQVELARADLAAGSEDPTFRRAAVQELAMLEIVVGGAEREAGNAAASEAAFRRAVALSAPLHSEAAPFLANQVARVFLARCLRRTQRYQDALAVIDAVLEELPPAVDASAERGWPVPRSVRAFALSERFQICMYGGAQNRALKAGPVALAAMADLLSDYPDAARHRRERAVVAGNLGLVHLRQGEDFAAAEAVLRLGTGDLERLSEEDPSDALARHFLVQQYKTLTYVLRKTAQWGELADFARRLAALPGKPENRRRAGSELVHCARGRGLGSELANTLLGEAMGLLLAARRAGSEFDATTAHYAPLRDLPGWDELAGQ